MITFSNLGGGAAKAAQVNYPMSAALELAGFGVTANMVYPPVTDTGWVTGAVREQVTASPDLIHIASPAGVAEVIAYLASRRGQAYHGQCDQAPLMPAGLAHADRPSGGPGGRHGAPRRRRAHNGPAVIWPM